MRNQYNKRDKRITKTTMTVIMLIGVNKFSTFETIVSSAYLKTLILILSICLNFKKKTLASKWWSVSKVNVLKFSLICKFHTIGKSLERS